MKLSEIKGERALEVLVDLIDPVTLIAADEEIVNTYKSKAPKILLVKKLIENHKKEVLTILAILNDENPETYEPSLIELPKMLLDLVHDEELMNLLHRRIRRWKANLLALLRRISRLQREYKGIYAICHGSV